MKITLQQDQLKLAVLAYLAGQGVQVPQKGAEVEFEVTRKGGVKITAVVDLSGNASIPAEPTKQKEPTKASEPAKVAAPVVEKEPQPEAPAEEAPAPVTETKEEAPGETKPDGGSLFG